MKRVVMFSGGAGSWATAKAVVRQHGAADVVLLFADTRVEEPDLYRFLEEAAAEMGAPLVRVADGRTPFEVFRDNRFLGNARLANCSKFLKQIPCRAWLEANADPADSVLYVGIDWTEADRLPAIEAGWAPYPVEAPLCKPPYTTKRQILSEMHDAGLTPPAAYADGMPHANCLAQGCVRGGQAYWARILETRPEAFAYAEREEQALRVYLDADVSILKDRRGGAAGPLTLVAFRERIEAGAQLDLFDWGGCGCATEAAQ